MKAGYQMGASFRPEPVAQPTSESRGRCFDFERGVASEVQPSAEHRMVDGRAGPGGVPGYVRGLWAEREAVSGGNIAAQSRAAMGCAALEGSEG